MKNNFDIYVIKSLFAHKITYGDHMLIISKKRIIFLCLTVILGISYFSINLSTVPTSSTPISSHILVLDAGHGYPDGGAVNSNGLSESAINLKIIQKLQELLEASNCTVILTRSDENGIYDANSKKKKLSDLQNRVEIVNNSNADALISIHLNKISQSQYYGWQSFYQKNNENSKNLAGAIQSNLNYSIQRQNKREILPISNIYLMDNSKIPSVIIECGFLSNLEEANLLQTDEYQNSLAWGIYTGIMDYFK